MHDSWITRYLDFTQHSEAPTSFHFWTAVGAIAGAVRRRVWFDMGYFRWYPNFFIIFVAPPGVVSKSTTADIGMSLLRRVPGLHFGPQVVTWPALIDAIADAREDYQSVNGNFVPMSAVTVVSSELGSFIQPGDASMLTILTDLWDGKQGSFEKRTRKDGIQTIENPFINLIGCTTPSWIGDNFSSSFIGGGFSSRCIFVYADHKRQLVPYPLDRLNSHRDHEADGLARRLEQIAMAEGPMLLSPDAHRWGVEWYTRLNASDNPLRMDPRFGGYFARLQTHLHKTGMVLRMARWSPGQTLEISRQDLEDAETALKGVEPNMMEVFGLMNKDKITDQMARVLFWIKTHSGASRQECYAAHMTQIGYVTFNEALEGLVGSGFIGLTAQGGQVILSYKGP